MGTDVDLAAVGKGVKRAILVQRAKVFAGQARSEAGELAKFGWSSTRSDELEKATATLEKLVSTQSAAQEEARVARDQLNLVLSEGHTYVRKLRVALRPILRSLPHGDTTKSMFKAGESLHNSVANLAAYFTKIRPGIEHLAPQLQVALPGPPPVEVLDQLKSRLDAASTAAAIARNRIPEQTHAINEAKGSVMLLLRDLSSAAQVAFDADEPRMSKFYLDMLGARAPRDTTTVTVSPATPAGAVTPVAPVSPPVVPAGGTGGAP